MTALVSEGKIKIASELPDVVSKDMPVFYNPIMKLNRDITIAVLRAGVHPQRIADPLAGTGVRTLRILKEVPGKLIEEIHANDGNPLFKKVIGQELKRNKILSKKLVTSTKDASVFLLESPLFDYIDIDPFGSPVPFLDAAIRKIKLGGMLAVTATDTAALCGTSVKACRRKYWAEPIRTPVMKEMAIRILIRRVQLIAASLEIVIDPLVSYVHEHYFRVFFRRNKGGSERIDDMLKLHRQGYWCSALQEASLAKNSAHPWIPFGPVWTGTLQDHAFISRISTLSDDKSTVKFLQQLQEESKVDSFGFIDIHALCKNAKLQVPPFERIKDEIKKLGGRSTRTQFSLTGLKSTLSSQAIFEIIKKLQKN